MAHILHWKSLLNGMKKIIKVKNEYSKRKIWSKKNRRYKIDYEKHRKGMIK